MTGSVPIHLATVLRVMRTDTTSEDDTEASDNESGYFPTFPYSAGAWGEGLGLRSFYGSGREDESDDVARDEVTTGSDESWLDDGLVGLLLVVGVVLFVFPEPSTSALGILLIVTGILMWGIQAIK